MNFNSDIHHRSSIRLKGYDYSQEGMYFVTICARDRECMFGKVVEGEMRLNEVGKVICGVWETLPKRFPNTHVDFFVVMPNHIHGIIVINENGRGGDPPALNVLQSVIEIPTIDEFHNTHLSTGIEPNGRAGGSPPLRRYNLGHRIAYFKYQTTRFINLENNSKGLRVWQRNYHEHIIRNEDELTRIRTYIQNNPLQWALDENNPENFKKIQNPVGATGRSLADCEVPS